MKVLAQLDSTRFVFIQEALAIGVAASVAKTFLPTFPILELFGLVVPVVTLAYTVKTWENNEAEKRNGKLASK